MFVQLALDDKYSLNPVHSITWDKHVNLMHICFTCVVVGTVGVRVFVIVPVLGGEHHACVVAHGVRQISRQMREVNGVVALWTIKVKFVFDEAPALFPVFQLDVKDGVALSGQRVDLPETQPKLPCERDITER